MSDLTNVQNGAKQRPNHVMQLLGVALRRTEAAAGISYRAGGNVRLLKSLVYAHGQMALKVKLSLCICIQVATLNNTETPQFI